MAKIVGIKFNHSSKVYYFAPGDVYYKKGSGVIVETAKGTEYGKVVIPPKDVSDDEIVSPLKPILRKANFKDEQRVEENESKAKKAFDIALEKIQKHNLEMKLIDVEYTFDGSKVIFYFSAPNRIDFRELVKDLAATFHIRIELKQIGARDEVKLLGGLGPCGRECCCAGTVCDFKKVSIKMAKIQGLSLNPGKISGLCGRLMCCLEYENPHYSETFKLMPKIGSEVGTPIGKATVISNNMLIKTVKVKQENEDGSFAYKDFPLADIVVKKANKEEDISDGDSEEVKNLEDN